MSPSSHYQRSTTLLRRPRGASSQSVIWLRSYNCATVCLLLLEIWVVSMAKGYLRDEEVFIMPLTIEEYRIYISIFTYICKHLTPHGKISHRRVVGIAWDHSLTKVSNFAKSDTLVCCTVISASKLFRCSARTRERLWYSGSESYLHIIFFKLWRFGIVYTLIHSLFLSSIQTVRQDIHQVVSKSNRWSYVRT